MGKKFISLKQKIAATPLWEGNVSKDFSVDNIKKQD